jgi:hypothetical protein
MTKLSTLSSTLTLFTSIGSVEGGFFIFDALNQKAISSGIRLSLNFKVAVIFPDCIFVSVGIPFRSLRHTFSISQVTSTRVSPSG